MNSNFRFGQKSWIFLGSCLLLGAVTLLLHQCQKKNEKLEKKVSHKKHPEKPSTKKEKTEGEILSENKRVVYLTFDDGPNNGTENLLKIIHEKKVEVTSFVVGKHAGGTSKQKEILENLHQDTLVEVANHSYTHANHQYSKFYENPELVVQDFNAAKDSMKLKTKIARTPGRNIWRTNTVNATDIKSSKKAADELQKNGYQLIGWDLEWKHDKDMKLKDNHEVMLKRIDSIFFNDLEKTSRHLVLLTHDQYLQDEHSVNELGLFIEKLQKSNQYQFKKISEYPQLNEVLR